MSGTGSDEAIWAVPRAFPGRPGTALHVWRIELTGAADPADPALSADERERAARLRIPVGRARFLESRIALRRILSGYLDTPAERIAFDYGETGKPSLRSAPETGREGAILFNLSHSGDLALCAVAEANVGADIEEVRDLSDIERLAERHFSGAELEVWRRTAPEDRIGAFFRVWTRKEALLKAAGLGLNRPLDRVDTQRGALDGVTYWLRDVAPGPGFAGAIACEEVPSRVRQWSWLPE